MGLNFAAYSDSCCIKSIPSASSNTELSIASASVSSLWVLHTGDDASKSSNRGSSKPKADSGVFANVIGYVLLGPFSGSAKNSPLLTKVELPLSTLKNWERQLLILKDSVIRLNDNSAGDQIENIIAESTAILFNIYYTLKPGADENSLTVARSKSGNAHSLDFCEISQNKKCSIAVGEAFFAALASSLSYKTGSLNLSDNSACVFLWFCLQ